MRGAPQHSPGEGIPAKGTGEGVKATGVSDRFNQLSHSTNVLAADRGEHGAKYCTAGCKAHNAAGEGSW